MKRSILGLLLILCLALLLPAAALAGGADEGTEGAPCSRTEGCALPGGHEDECVVESPQQPCSQTEGCTLPGGHEGECATAPANEEENPLPDGEGFPTNGAMLLSGGNGEKDTPWLVENAEELTDAFEKGGYIQLKEDISVSTVQNWTVKKDVVLDLNGHTVTSRHNASNYFLFTVSDAELTIDDSSETKNGMIDTSSAQQTGGVKVYSNGTFTLAGGSFQTKGVALDVPDNNTNVTINISGGSLTSTYDNVMRINGKGTKIHVSDGYVRVDSRGSGIFLSSDNAADRIQFEISGGEVAVKDGIRAVKNVSLTLSGNGKVIAGTTIKLEENSSLLVSGGTSVGNLDANKTCDISMCGGKVEGSVILKGESTFTLSAGEIIDDTWHAIETLGQNNVTISGGSIETESAQKAAVAFSADSTATITGGFFTGKQTVTGTAGKVVISGGVFSSLPADDLLADGVITNQLPDGSFVVGSNPEAQIGTQSYVRLSYAVAAAQPGDTIKLLKNVQLAENTALQFVEKGTEEDPVTLDLNGHDITGSNSNTGRFYNSASKAGILWISQSHVVLTDNSAGEKGSIINQHASANNCTVLVTAPQATATTSLQVRGGITINNESSKSSSKVLNLYSRDSTNGETRVTLEDVAMSSSKGNIISASNRENLKLNIQGGTYRTQATSSSSTARVPHHEGVVSISGGTFIHAQLDRDHVKLVEAGKSVVFSKTVEGQQQVIVQDEVPQKYAAYLQNESEGYAVYLAESENNLNLVEDFLAVSGTRVELRKSMELALSNSFGATSGTPATLTFELAQGVTLSGELKLKVADVIISGQGNLANGFTCTPASEDYTVSKEENANIWHGQLADASRVLQLTTPENNIYYFSSADISNAFTTAAANPGSTLQLLQNISTKGTRTISKALTIDLNGHTWTLAYQSLPATYISIPSTGSVQLINTNKEEGVLKANESSTVAVSIQGGSLSIGENVKVTGNTILLEEAPRGKLTVAGTIDTTGTANTPIMGNGKGDSDDTVITIEPGAKIIADATLGAAGIYHPQDGTLIINGGEISGDSGIYMKAGTLQMNGGKVTGSGPKENYTHNPNGYVCTGDAIVLDACDYPGGAPAAEIKGGEISSKNNQPVSCYLKNGATDIANKQFISGGKFSGDVSQYIAAQHSGLVTQDAVYPFWVGDYNDETAQQALKNKGVARLQVNQANVYYTSLQEAVAAAGENAVITLIADTDEAFAIGKPLVIMRNGFTASQISAGTSYRLVKTEGSYLIIPAPVAGTTYAVKYYLGNVEQTGDAQSGLTAEELSAALDKTYADYHLLRIEGPGTDNTYHVYYARNVYQVTVQIYGRGTAEATPNSAISGSKIQLSAAAQPGYRFAGWRVLEGDVTIAADGSFTMPQQNVTVLATFTLRSGSSSSSRDYYQLRFDVNGGNAISALRRVENTTIDLNNYTPVREGYRFTGWYADAALSERITSIRLTEDTTVYAGWQKITQLPFLDIDETDSYYDAVCYVYENGLIIGTSGTLYSPDMSITRGMIATILWRVEGKPAAGANPFPDVAAGSYYESAIAWAAANGVINGYEDGNYRPNEAISREELAAILYRYALNKGYASAAAEHAALTQADAGTVLDWAVPAMQWACETGVLSARADGLLQPGAEASRAETAVAFYVLAGTLAAQ